MPILVPALACLFADKTLSQIRLIGLARLHHAIPASQFDNNVNCEWCSNVHRGSHYTCLNDVDMTENNFYKCSSRIFV